MQEKVSFLPTYCDVVKKSESAILLFTNNVNNPGVNCDVVHMLKKFINLAETKVCINGVKSTQNGAAIYCNDVENLNKLKEAIISKFGDIFEIDEAQKHQPRILVKIVQITEDNANLIDNIKMLNKIYNILVLWSSKLSLF